MTLREDIERILSETSEADARGQHTSLEQRRYERLVGEMRVLLRNVEDAMAEAAKIKGVRRRMVEQRVLDELRGLDQESWRVFQEVRKSTYLARAKALEERPEAMPDKLRRVIMLSNLRYGTPQWEIQAMVDRMLNDLDVLGPEEAPPL